VEGRSLLLGQVATPAGDGVEWPEDPVKIDCRALDD